MRDIFQRKNALGDTLDVLYGIRKEISISLFSLYVERDKAVSEFCSYVSTTEEARIYKHDLHCCEMKSFKSDIELIQGKLDDIEESIGCIEQEFFYLAAECKPWE